MEAGGREKTGIFRRGVRGNMNKFANNECALHQMESGRGIRRVYLRNVRGRAFDLFRRRLKMTHAA